MSDAKRRRWVSEYWPEDARPYDHLRSLIGVADILEEYIHSRWEKGEYLGLEVPSKTIRQATNGLDAHFKISERVGSDAETEGGAHV